MAYNLTENQKQLARWLVAEVRDKRLPESFVLRWMSGRRAMVAPDNDAPSKREAIVEFNRGELDALAQARVLIQSVRLGSSGAEAARRCTLTGLAYRAVDTNFAEESIIPFSTLAQPHPAEISLSLDRLRAKYPDPKKLGFLVMRFTAAKPFERIVEVIKQTGLKHDLNILRADENEFHSDLWGNVRTYLHGCGFGIAIYERIETEEPNANVGLEVGYLMAMNKPVLLLKDNTVQELQADLAGKLYKQFDPHDPEGTIPDQLTKWLRDYGVIVTAK